MTGRRARPGRLREVSGPSRRRATAAGSFSRRRRRRPSSSRGTRASHAASSRSRLESSGRAGVFTHELGASLGDLDAACRDHGVASVQLSRDQLDAWLEAPEPLAVDVAGIGAYRNLIVPDDAAPSEHRVRRAVPRGGATGRHVGGLDARRHAAPTGGVVGLTRKPLPEARSLFLDAVERLLVAERAGTILALEGSVKSVLRTTAQVIELFDRFLPRTSGSSATRTTSSRGTSCPPTSASPPRFSTASNTGSSSPTSRTSGRTAPRCRHRPWAVASSCRRPTSRSCGNAAPTCG